MIAKPFDRRRRTRSGAGDRLRVVIVLAILLLLEFYLRPSLIEGRGMPDFLSLILLLLAIRQRPGAGAVTGFLIGTLIDVLNPAHFGANILAHVLVGWGAAWGRGIFFADNLIVNAGLFFIGTWVRNLLVLLLSGTSMSHLLVDAFYWSTLQSLSTAGVGIVVVIVARDWLSIRIER